MFVFHDDALRFAAKEVAETIKLSKIMQRRILGLGIAIPDDLGRAPPLAWRTGEL